MCCHPECNKGCLAIPYRYPPFRSGPHLVTSVIRPSGLYVILTLRQDLAGQVLIHEEKPLISQFKLDGATAKLRGDVEADQPIGNPVYFPAVVPGLFEFD